MLSVYYLIEYSQLVMLLSPPFHRWKNRDRRVQVACPKPWSQKVLELRFTL